eukprot:UN17087
MLKLSDDKTILKRLPERLSVHNIDMVYATTYTIQEKQKKRQDKG